MTRTSLRWRITAALGAESLTVARVSLADLLRDLSAEVGEPPPPEAIVILSARDCAPDTLRSYEDAPDSAPSTDVDSDLGVEFGVN